MSRYVDLDGKTWDGTPIHSKIQEVKTKHGYMQGITIGWLWGDNVPKLDLEKNNKAIYNQALEDLLDKVKKHHYLLSDKINSTDYGMFTCGIEQVVDELKR